MRRPVRARGYPDELNRRLAADSAGGFAFGGTGIGAGLCLAVDIIWGKFT